MLIYHTILSRNQKWFGERSSWIIESVYGNYFNISIYNPGADAGFQKI